MSPPLSSPRTEAVLAEGRPWQARPLASVSPLLSCDALCVPARQEGPVQTTAVSRARGVTRDGEKARLGWWRSERAGAQFWLSVFTALHHRGVQDCLIAWVDGRQGLPAALEAVCPKPQVPLGLVHKGRHRLQDGPWQERRAGAADLRAISGAAPRPAAAHARARFAARWDTQYPASSPSWRAAWDRLPVCVASPPALRRAV